MHKKISRVRLTAMIGISVFTLLMLTFVVSSESAAQRDDGPRHMISVGLGCCGRVTGLS